MDQLQCSICGGTALRHQEVLWPELVAQWQLAAHEAAYVNRQQGTTCTACGANLRIIALGNAVRAAVGTRLTLHAAIAAGELDGLQILDCNGAEGISAALAGLPGYHRADYPACDMRHMPFLDGSFQLVIHSDTLEHIEHPLAALEECRRVLSPSGRLCFTIPIIVGRKTRDRAGLEPSYHGDPVLAQTDFVVHTEFGADAWTLVHEAGFTGLAMHQVDYPSAIAISAWTDPPPATGPDQETAPAAAEPPSPQPGVYDQDGLRSLHNHEFMDDPGFKAAYARGVEAAGADYHWHWRVHTGLWAARLAAHLPGDFAEFGVNRGFLSSAIMHLLDWNSTGRRFYLLDTFAGIDERYINEDDRDVGVIERNKHDIDSGFYTFDVESVRRNYAEWPEAIVIVGPVPETLAAIDSDCFAFAHIDMNCAPPEVAAAEFIWPRLVPGGIILLDDYAYVGYRSQKLAMDAFAASKGVEVLSLPTGQGLIVKPAA
jgi:SAM-dependent methyltransferase